ncbi:helix-turn-helix transcriptional regulator [Staphylococcus warneri]|uniref:helix-turn-helix domain-containing protein n=1 Tax=Staphylococcus warneri TaxID=1292 RepID=UPI001038C6DD|nr:helix-turn-helix transcriptional regulator [Staphylococcus warneri]MBF2179191.1 helix-turn-helix transcriptional regulator [Staphylococcus warneri]MBF2181582.1 helix-turn-helix transcriptional regulator [Staphylococcus warneri]MBF2186112.1 helix-turn-helix transcriptional regulator [Staphylococcus warneri]MBF2263481.1 helix-turn-helix transcriptional regulator [Staphylococcus warneri]MBF2266197.1 helix-turn-helix transcriptional regulator [Staphylococcus warneri]
MTFGDNLKRIRKDMRLTQQDMADRMNISRTYLCDLENRNKSISITTLLDIAKRLNISVNELINDNINMDKEVYNKKEISK